MRSALPPPPPLVKLLSTTPPLLNPRSTGFPRRGAAPSSSPQAMERTETPWRLTRRRVGCAADTRRTTAADARRRAVLANMLLLPGKARPCRTRSASDDATANAAILGGRGRCLLLLQQVVLIATHTRGRVLNVVCAPHQKKIPGAPRRCIVMWKNFQGFREGLLAGFTSPSGRAGGSTTADSMAHRGRGLVVGPANAVIRTKKRSLACR